MRKSETIPIEINLFYIQLLQRKLIPEFLLEIYHCIEFLMYVYKNSVYLFKYYFVFSVSSMAQIILESERILFLAKTGYPLGNKE